MSLSPQPTHRVTWKGLLLGTLGLQAASLLAGGVLEASAILNGIGAHGGWEELFHPRSLHYFYSWGPVFPFMIWFTLRFPLARGTLVRALLAHVLVVLLLVMPLKALEATVGWLLVPEGSIPQWHMLWNLERLPRTFFSNLANVVLFYPFFVALIKVVHDRKVLGALLERKQRLEALLAEAELRSLKMQLHPHFLFNALNALTVLIKRRPEEAKRMVDLLEDLLRRSMEAAHVHEVTLIEELDLLQLYLQIEQIRFAGHLEVRMDVAAEAREARVPHLILQPLVENAVRHGIGPKTSPGWVLIQARASEGRLRLRVEDDGVGPQPGSWAREGEGIGLANTQARLAHTFGSEAHFSHGPRPEGGFLVELDLPLRRTPEAPPRHPS